MHGLFSGVDSFLSFLSCPKSVGTNTQLSKENGASDGICFIPLPGFLFGAFGSVSLESPIQRRITCDEPIISAVLFLEGMAEYSIGGRRYDLQKNMFILGRWRNREVEVALPAQDGCSLVGFMVQESVLEDHFGCGLSSDVRASLGQAVMQSPGGGESVSGIAKPGTLIDANNILDMQAVHDAGGLQLRGKVFSLFAKFIHQAAEAASRPAVSVHDDDRRRLADLKAIIESRYSSIHSAAKICSEIGMSFSKANKAFKALYSTTIAQYIQQCRMAYAYSALSNRQHNVGECASEVGYSNTSHFIEAFKKHYGMTPKAVSRFQSEGGAPQR